MASKHFHLNQVMCIIPFHELFGQVPFLPDALTLWIPRLMPFFSEYEHFAHARQQSEK